MCAVLNSHSGHAAGMITFALPVNVRRIGSAMRRVSSISEAAQRTTSVLCINDDESALQQQTLVLEAAGYRVCGALNGKAAVKLFVAEEIDLIVSGLLFPGVSGAELSIYMRQVRPEVSVVLLSRTKQLPPALLSQVDGHVDRDGDTGDLVNCVQEVLARKTANQQRRA